MDACFCEHDLKICDKGFMLSVSLRWFGIKPDGMSFLLAIHF